MGRSVKELHPKVRKAAFDFIKAAGALNADVFVTVRTFAEQAALYEQGRTKPGKIVTNSKAGYSYHNYGLALDVVFKPGGNWSWDGNWQGLGDLGKKFGFEWGGGWASFPDRPHFQMTFGLSIEQLYNVYKIHNSLTEVWDYITKEITYKQIYPANTTDNVPALSDKEKIQVAKPIVKVKTQWQIIIDTLTKMFISVWRGQPGRK